jgi:PAS domain S-box-containing protein
MTKKKDGTLLPVLISSSPIVRAGQTQGVRAVLTDISEQIAAEEEIRESEARYRGLFASSLDGILVVSLSTGMITDANQAFLDMIGYPLAELRMKVYTELTPERWHGMEMEIIRDQVLARDFSDEYEKEIVRKDGTVVPMSVRRWLIKDKDGSPIGMWSILRDITEKRRREEDIERANAELLRYAQTVSHDLKGPIHEVTMAEETIRLLIEMPQNEQTEGFIAESFELMRHGLERANHLIDDMLVLAESGQVPREVEAVSVSEKVAEILAERAADIEIRNIEVKLDEDMGVLIASPTHVYQIFSNLIKNAITYGDTLNPVIEIRSLGGVGDGSHRFIVRDNGAGIPDNLAESIFMPFSKGSKGDTGIGLSIVQRLTEVYGGRVRVYNDCGACFELHLNDYKK